MIFETRSIYFRLLNYHPGRLFKGTMVMSIGTGLRLLGQTCVFIVVARVLGTEEYGAYAAVLALAMAFGSFSGLGSSVIMLQKTARDPSSFKKSFGCALSAWIVTSPIFFILYGWVGLILFQTRVEATVLFFLGIAEVVLSPLIFFMMHAFQGHERISYAAYLAFLQVASRLLATGMLLLLHQIGRGGPSLVVWSLLYLLATGFTAVYAFSLARRKLSAPLKFEWFGVGNAIRRGWFFSLGGTLDKACVDGDKLMLSRLSTLEITGAYSAAYRMVDLVGVPILSFFSAALPRFFQAGQYGLNQSIRFATKVMPYPMVYALITCVLLFFLSEYLPYILGSAFEPAVIVLQILAWLPLLTVPRLFMQTLVATSGRQQTMVSVLACGACINIITNLYTIPKWGWLGAVGATYLSELMMNILLFYLIFFRRGFVWKSISDLTH